MNNDTLGERKKITQEEFETILNSSEKLKCFQSINMSNIDFNEKDCSNITFKDIVISNKKLIGTNFKNAKFEDCAFFETVFNSCLLNGARFWDSQIMRIEFWRSELQSVSFENTYLTDSKIVNCIIKYLDFSRAKSIPKTIDPGIISCHNIMLPESFSKINLGGQIFVYDYYNDRVIVRNNNEFGKLKVISHSFDDFRKKYLLDVYNHIIKLFEYHKFIMEARKF